MSSDVLSASYGLYSHSSCIKARIWLFWTPLMFDQASSIHPMDYCYLSLFVFSVILLLYEGWSVHILSNCVSMSPKLLKMSLGCFLLGKWMGVEWARFWLPTSSWTSLLLSSSQVRAPGGFPLDKAFAAKIKSERILGWMMVNVSFNFKSQIFGPRWNKAICSLSTL